MEASYTWHPGAHCLNPRWPLTPALLPDELFSSWLVRTAHAHGCTLDVLTGAAEAGPKAWHHDVDRGVSELQIAGLSRQAGIPPQALSASTLLPTAQVLHRLAWLHRSSVWPWLLVAGCRNAAHAGGLQCCPACISTCPPHHQIQARLAWHTCCVTHHIQLIDCCPSCYAALQPALLQPTVTLDHCHQCLSMLHGAPFLEVDSGALAFQVYADQAFGRTAFFGKVELTFSDWMFVSRVMVSMIQGFLRHPSTSAKAFCHSMELEGVDKLQRSTLGLPFEYLSCAERSGLLGVVWAIMQAGPERFLLAAAEASLPLSSLPLPRRSAPLILSALSTALTKHTPHQCPQHANEPGLHKVGDVLRSWVRLQRRIRRDGIP